MRLACLLCVFFAAMGPRSEAVAGPCAGVFTDVDTSASYCPAVAFLKDRGITTGCTLTTYCPNEYVTRAQMALFMQRLATKALAPAFVTASNIALPVLFDGAVICLTDPYTPAGFPRVSTAQATFTFNASASFTAAVELVYSIDGGSTWAPMSPLRASAAPVGGQFTSLSPVSSPTEILPNTSAIFAIRTFGAMGAGVGTCAISVRLDPYNA